MPETIVLVACVKEKANTALPAKDLYISGWFKKAAAAAQVLGPSWFILSTKHGLLNPDTIVEPYQKAFRDMDDAERKYWAENVFRQLQQVLTAGDTLVFLADKDYYEILLELLQTLCVHTQTPLAGLTVEDQMCWFDDQLEESQSGL